MAIRYAALLAREERKAIKAARVHPRSEESDDENPDDDECEEQECEDVAEPNVSILCAWCGLARCDSGDTCGIRALEQLTPLAEAVGRTPRHPHVEDDEIQVPPDAWVIRMPEVWAKQLLDRVMTWMIHSQPCDKAPGTTGVRLAASACSSAICLLTAPVPRVSPRRHALQCTYST